MFLMLGRGISYIVGLLIVGLLFSGLTMAVLGFIPYFIAGLVLTAPLYGWMRQIGKIKARSTQERWHAAKRWVWGKRSFSLYFVLMIVSLTLSQRFGYTIDETLRDSVIALVASVLIWEILHISMKMAKKNFPSYLSAIKGV